MVAMGKTLCGWPAMVGLAFAVMAGCLGGPDEPEEWQGLVHHSCGPTDGPAAYIQVDSAAAPACRTGEGNIPVHGTYGFTLDWIEADSLKAGEVYRDTMQICQLQCGPRTWYTLKVESVTTDRVVGTLEVDDEVGGARRTIRKVRVNLKTCPQKTIICG